jgi:hypothetical protein
MFVLPFVARFYGVSPQLGRWASTPPTGENPRTNLKLSPDEKAFSPSTSKHGLHRPEVFAPSVSVQYSAIHRGLPIPLLFR